MRANDTLSWYEAGLSSGERKRRGHFSTPPYLVEQMLDACGYTSANDLSRLRVLDPACGSGNFLAGAARRLIASGRQRKLASRELAESVQQQIWGFDPDPVACFLAEMQLRTALSTAGGWPRRGKSVRDLAHLPLHIHQADGLTLPWEQCENVDLFLANPPYLAAKNNDLSGYRSAQQRGQADSYLLFVSLALQVVRPDGWIGLVLPDPVLARANASRERQRLLAETTIHHLWHLAGVFSAYVGAAVLIAQKRAPRSVHQIAWKREQWQPESGASGKGHARLTKEGYRSRASYLAGSKTVAQAYLRGQPGAELRYLLSEVRATLVGCLHEHMSTIDDAGSRTLTSLGKLATLRRGEEIGKYSPVLSMTRPDDTMESYPVLRGGIDLHPYGVPSAQCWIVRREIEKPLEHYLAPKLLVVKSTGRLQATLDLQGHVVLQTLYLLHLRNSQDRGKEEEELYFLLALLNSRLLREYVYVLHTAYKWVQPQIEQHVLASLPIPIIETAGKERIIARARHLMGACSDIAPVVELEAHGQDIYEGQEREICALYEEALEKDRRPSTAPSQHSVDKGVTFYG